MVHYKNGAKPVRAHTFSDRQELRALLGRSRAKAEPQGAEQPASEPAADSPAAATTQAG
jgi:hypothetical protein